MLFDESPFSNICAFWYVTIECIELEGLLKHMKKFRSSQASISVSCCTEKINFLLWLALSTTE